MHLLKKLSFANILKPSVIHRDPIEERLRQMGITGKEQAMAALCELLCLEAEFAPKSR